VHFVQPSKNNFTNKQNGAPQRRFFIPLPYRHHLRNPLSLKPYGKTPQKFRGKYFGKRGKTQNEFVEFFLFCGGEWDFGVLSKTLHAKLNNKQPKKQIWTE
jgi:hypothetical protein